MELQRQLRNLVMGFFFLFAVALFDARLSQELCAEAYRIGVDGWPEVVGLYEYGHAICNGAVRRLADRMASRCP
jgi:hypothetical protein